METHKCDFKRNSVTLKYSFYVAPKAARLFIKKRIILLILIVKKGFIMTKIFNSRYYQNSIAKTEDYLFFR